MHRTSASSAATRPPTQGPPRVSGRRYLRWLPTFLAFPIAGLAARAVAGNIDDPASALLGGAVAGVVIGVAQAAALGGDRADRIRWTVATVVGMTAGLTAGAAAVDHETTAAALTVMGLVSGAGVGVAQAIVLSASATRRVAWAVAIPTLWGLGWLITSQVIVDADRQHASFGASGAVVVTLLSGLVLAGWRTDEEPAHGVVVATTEVGA